MHLAPFQRHTDEDESMVLKYERGCSIWCKANQGLLKWLPWD